MSKNITLKYNEEYFKINAENILSDLKENTSFIENKKNYEINNLVDIYMDKEKNHYYISKKLNYLSFNINIEDEEVINSIEDNLQYLEKDFSHLLSNGLTTNEIKSLERYIDNKVSNFLYEMKRNIRLEYLVIPVSLNFEIFFNTSFEVNELLDNKIVNISPKILIPKKENSLNTFKKRNKLYSLSLPNQYQTGKLCLGDNLISLSKILNGNDFSLKNFDYVYQEFLNGMFNDDLSYIEESHDIYLEILYRTLKDFAIKNQFSEDILTKTVSNILIKQFKKDSFKLDLENKVCDIDFSDSSFFNDSKLFYILISFFIC